MCAVALVAIPAYGQGIFYVRNGNAGVGTSNPTEAFHVKGSDGEAQILIEETSPTSLRRRLLQIRNNGAAQFSLSDGANTWLLANRVDGFEISKGGTGVSEFVVEANGDGRFEGDVYADGVRLTSSRAAKTDFQTIDSADLLARLASIEVMRWRYRDGEESHIGPMAEDFADAFGLDDREHLSVIDANGVALAGIQALQAMVERQAERIRALEEQVSALTDDTARPLGR